MGLWFAEPIQIEQSPLAADAGVRQHFDSVLQLVRDADDELFPVGIGAEANP